MIFDIFSILIITWKARLHNPTYKKHVAHDTLDKITYFFL